MDHRFAMGGFQIVLLLSVQFASQTTAADPHLHLQNVYPGCRSSQNDSAMSLPECSRSNFFPENSSQLPEFGEFFINTSQLTDCFLNSSSKIIIHSVYEGYAVFEGGDTSPDVSAQYLSCTVSLSGPPGSVFQIQVIYFNSAVDVLFSDHQQNYPYDRFSSEGYTTFTRNNNFFLNMTVAGIELGSLAFNFSIQAVPECQRQLRVSCFSGTSGFIETPGWSDGNDYINDMNSCVTLHVPEDYVIMISLISIDMEPTSETSGCYDSLNLYESSNCTGLEKKICQAGDLPPTVINGTGAVSFRFYSDVINRQRGFRLLYSFHNRSEEPHKLPDGSWNCSVSNYQAFKQHFVCLAESFCSDKRDRVICPEDDECGSNLKTTGGSCYRIFQPVDPITWNFASNACKRFGGILVVLYGASKLNQSIEFIKENEVADPVFVGLEMTSNVRLHEMYQNTWIWSGDILAVYLPISYKKAFPPYCAALDGDTLITVSCRRKIKAAFLCETNFLSVQTQNLTQISMSTHSEWNADNMTTCPHGHVTHTFLACDVSSNCFPTNHKECLECTNRFSPPVPIFTCRNQAEYLPYTLVCDFRDDCCDGSDEDFCVFPACKSRIQYECADGKQCILSKYQCDKLSHCVDGSDEFKCWGRLSQSHLLSNDVLPPAVVDFTGYGDFTVSRNLSNFHTETHFLCPGTGYFLPIYVRCNEFIDCPGKEDELDCDHYTCPGFYRCRESKICLHIEHLCDSVFQCPQRDDELMCDFICPENCHCYGYAFICTDIFIPDDYVELRYLDAKGTGMNPEDFLYNTKLIHLSLCHCKISTFGKLNLPNLQNLDLSYNHLRELNSNQFIKLENLISVSLAYNPLISMASLFYSDLKFSKIIVLNLSGVMIQEINETFLNTLPNIRYLNISGSGLEKTTQTGFQHMSNLLVLDLRGCPLDIFFPGVFKGLHKLETIYTDNYKLCCPAVLPEGMNPENCYAPTDEISSCDALLRADVFRVFLVIYAFLALTGNLGSFVYRAFFEKGCTKMGYQVFVTHLCVADFVMGVYLAIIGIADRYYFGDYRWHDTTWKHSVICKMAGLLSLVSSEVSGYLICLITLERFLVIRFPNKNLRFSRRSAHIASMTVWLIGLVLALIPLLPMTSHWHFYGQSGICVPLPITRKQFPGSDYAFGVIIVVNFILFLFIAVVQLLIYWFIRATTATFKDHSRKSKDVVVARRLLAVVMTNFLCWFPIGMLGVMARTGVPVSSKINVAMAIFVLPFNSALNPFIYTFNVLMERLRNAKQVQMSHNNRKSCSFNDTSRACDAEAENKETRHRKEEVL